MKTKCLIYCTKNGGRLVLHRLFNGGYDFTLGKQFSYNDDDCNGKVVAECEVEVEEIYPCMETERYETDSSYFGEYNLQECSCLYDYEIGEYLCGKVGYALHISNLKVFDRPLELKEVKINKNCKNCQYNFDCIYHPEVVCDDIPLTKAPQNMMWVWYKGEKYCLISIRPEWVAKILNGEKTIEVRKKVLKEMI